MDFKNKKAKTGHRNFCGICKIFSLCNVVLQKKEKNTKTFFHCLIALGMHSYWSTVTLIYCNPCIHLYHWQLLCFFWNASICQSTYRSWIPTCTEYLWNHHLSHNMHLSQLLLRWKGFKTTSGLYRWIYLTEFYGTRALNSKPNNVYFLLRKGYQHTYTITFFPGTSTLTWNRSSRNEAVINVGFVLISRRMKLYLHWFNTNCIFILYPSIPSPPYRSNNFILEQVCFRVRTMNSHLSVQSWSQSDHTSATPWHRKKTSVMTVIDKNN